MPQHWQVLGPPNVPDVGLPVTMGQAAASAQLPERLLPGAIVEERELSNNRLRFRLLSGTGPLTGWTSTLCAGRVFLEEHIPAKTSSDAASNQRGSGVGSGRGVIVPPTNASASQWLSEVEEPRHRSASTSSRRSNASVSSAVGDDESRPCGITRIQWFGNDGRWHTTAKEWKLPLLQHEPQEWDLNEMDVVSGVRVQPVGDAVICPEVRPFVEVPAYCIKCPGCMRPPGHRGHCKDSAGKVVVRRPRAGVYNGIARNETCPGDDVTYEVRLSDDGLCAIECIPKLSLFAGGQPAWKCEGAWSCEDGEAVVQVTKEDIRGPKEDTELRMQIVSSSQALVFRGAQCQWQQPLPLPENFDLTGWWTLSPAGPDSGDVVHVRFEHSPGSETFTGHQKDFTEIKDGILEGRWIYWVVDDFLVKGHLENEGRLIAGIEVLCPQTGFKARFSAKRSVLEAGLCSVCLEDYEPGEAVRDLPCRHRFHEACVDRWLLRSRRCPVCRGAALP
mmetsp:Transcript_76422/g.181785  ORF Transcript_76422/g.181785 Transcript_76422/m.181785 type:complete len:503 (+) Transcript_76422:120-1628(+)